MYDSIASTKLTPPNVILWNIKDIKWETRPNLKNNSTYEKKKVVVNRHELSKKTIENKTYWGKYPF